MAILVLEGTLLGGAEGELIGHLREISSWIFVTTIPFHTLTTDAERFRKLRHGSSTMVVERDLLAFRVRSRCSEEDEDHEPRLD